MCYHKKSQIDIVYKAYNSIIKFYDLNIQKKVMFIHLLILLYLSWYSFPFSHPKKLMNNVWQSYSCYVIVCKKLQKSMADVKNETK
jgi:hypothetical protein